MAVPLQGSPAPHPRRPAVPRDLRRRRPTEGRAYRPSPMWSLITGRERALTAAQRIIRGRFGRQRTSASAEQTPRSCVAPSVETYFGARLPCLSMSGASTPREPSWRSPVLARSGCLARGRAFLAGGDWDARSVEGTRPFSAFAPARCDHAERSHFLRIPTVRAHRSPGWQPGLCAPGAALCA
jgi:hypothetical protein